MKEKIARTHGMTTGSAEIIMNELLKMVILCYNTISSVNFAPMRINTGVGGVFAMKRKHFGRPRGFPPINGLGAR